MIREKDTQQALIEVTANESHAKKYKSEMEQNGNKLQQHQLKYLKTEIEK